MTDDILFSPFAIKNFTLKNRLGVAPMTRMSSLGDGIPRQDVLDFLVRRATNGAALVYTEAIVTDYESAQGYPRQARIVTQKQIDAWKAVTDQIRAAGALSIMQIFHCGRMGWPEVNPAGRIIAPSPLTPKQRNPVTGRPYPIPEVMSRFDIEHVVHGFAESARGAIAAGFDGVEVHGAHGYLICQFLSSYSNQRTDEYGGTVQNRFRFAREVLQAVRPEIPVDRLLTFRISNWGVADPEVSLFAGAEEYQTVVRLLAPLSLDAISVSTYRYDQDVFATGKTMARLTRDVTDLPLMICGQIHDRPSADNALKDADVVLSAKSMLLNPNWVEAVRTGKKLPRYSSEEANVAYTETPLP